jgi:phosphohistidine phosphatase
MRELLILRHAKSSWKHEGLADHDRPLNKRGKKDAPRMGRLLLEGNLVPDRILSSTAVRATTTSRLVADGCGFEGDIVILRSLYLSHPSGYLEALQAVPDEHRRVMVVGHNPGLEDLLLLLTRNRRTLPTAALASVRLPIGGWNALEAGIRGELAGLWKPKELEA